MIEKILTPFLDTIKKLAPLGNPKIFPSELVSPPPVKMIAPLVQNAGGSVSLLGLSFSILTFHHVSCSAYLLENRVNTWSRKLR